jgi:hypothetical protein
LFQNPSFVVVVSVVLGKQTQNWRVLFTFGQTDHSKQGVRCNQIFIKLSKPSLLSSDFWEISPWGWSGWGMMLTTRYRLALKLRMQNVALPQNQKQYNKTLSRTARILASVNIIHTSIYCSWMKCWIKLLTLWVHVHSSLCR